MSDSFATPWTVARHGPVSKGFPRQEYWSRLPFPSPGDLSDPGIQHIMGYYSAVIRNRVPVSVITWMKHENIKLSERS